MYPVIVVFFLCFYSCSGVIYHLNESEYARMPPLYGLDEYSSCLVASEGTYCVLRLDLYSQNNTSLISMIREYSESKIKHYNHTYIQRGVCVTTTCKNYIKNHSLYTTEALTETLGECLNDSIHRDYGLEAQLTTLHYCERKDQTIDIDVGDWIVFGVYVAIITINIIGTLYDVIISSSSEAIKGNAVLLSFSIINNWKKLISAEPEEVRIKRLSGLHGARVLTLFLMFTAHIMWVNSMGFNDNIHEFEELYDNTYYQLIFNGMVIIQVFFVISGFLLVYNLEIYSEKHRISWGMASKIWFMRWWRLTPSYAIVLAFMTTWLRHIGSGPLWRMFVADSVVADCRRYWWAHLLYINNYIHDGNFCAIHTWHIATDTQLFCVGLAAYLLTRRGGRRAMLAALVAAGVVLPAVHVLVWDLDALVLMTPEFYRAMVNDTFHYMHVHGHVNLVCYAIGMATGYIVYRLQKKGVDIADNKLCIFLAWLIIPSMVLVIYSGSVFYVDGWRAPLWLRALYAALQRPAIGVATAYGLIVLTLRCNTFLRRFFEWRGWVAASRLAYSVYLLHISVIHAHLGLSQHMGHASTFYMTLLHFGVVVLTFMIALPFSLMVEAPLMRLLKLVSGREQEDPPSRSQRTKC